MDDVDANQLPEVDSLPDGFVDSSHEPLAPPTPTIELEKPPTLSDCDRHSISDSDQPNGTLAHVLENESQTCCKSNEPNHLTEMDGFDGSMKSVDNARVEDVESTIAVPASTNLDANSSIRLSGRRDVKGQVPENCQSPGRSGQRDSGTHGVDSKEISSSQITEKGRKPEHPETKRKNAKRSFKSEEEFLEFSLKYQQVLAERDAAIVVRDKLESLCRELQRQNKMLMEECKRVSTEGQNLRLDLSTKFQDAIKDVSVRLEEQKEECFSQLKENEMLRTKLKQLADQYAISEQQHAQKLKQKTLEHQIAELKIKQHEEKLAQEQSQMKVYAEQVSQLLATEKSLRMKLTADGEKFQQFQDALLKSHEVFETFKQEIDKMAKSIKELKKENLFLKSKTEKSDVTLIELVEEREKLKKQLEKTKKQKEKLESLCRSLQAERKQNSNGDSLPGTVPSDS